VGYKEKSERPSAVNCENIRVFLSYATCTSVASLTFAKSGQRSYGFVSLRALHSSLHTVVGKASKQICIRLVAHVFGNVKQDSCCVQIFLAQHNRLRDQSSSNCDIGTV
jgi:hypothetical protein